MMIKIMIMIIIIMAILYLPAFVQPQAPKAPAGKQQQQKQHWQRQQRQQQQHHHHHGNGNSNGNGSGSGSGNRLLFWLKRIHLTVTLSPRGGFLIGQCNGSRADFKRPCAPYDFMFSIKPMSHDYKLLFFNCQSV